MRCWQPSLNGLSSAFWRARDDTVPRVRTAETGRNANSAMRLVKLELEISRTGLGFFILGLVCSVETAARLFAELVFCESTKMFPLEKGSGEQVFAS